MEQPLLNELLPDMSGKVCMVTGATAGIGKAVASGLAQLNADVVLVGNDEKECISSVAEICRKTENPEVTYLLADLSSQRDIRRITKAFKQTHSRLDVLVNNAGAVFMQRRKTVDGIEMTFALNHLSYFLLTMLLMDTLMESSPARIINITSAIHSQGQLDFNDIENESGYNGLVAYAQSKLENIMFTVELAHRIWGSGVTANALHPGHVASNLGQNNAGILKPLIKWLHMGGISPQEAARPVLYLACSPQAKGVTGRYFNKDHMDDPKVDFDRQSTRLLWQISAAMAGIQENQEVTA